MLGSTPPRLCRIETMRFCDAIEKSPGTPGVGSNFSRVSI